MATNRSHLGLVTDNVTADGGIDHELRLFIDRAIVPILVQRWAEQSVGAESEKVEVNCEELPAAA
jgi:hypothetical protein